MGKKLRGTVYKKKRLKNLRGTVFKKKRRKTVFPDAFGSPGKD